MIGDQHHLALDDPYGESDSRRIVTTALPLIERAGVARPTTVGTDTLRQRIAEELASAHAVVTYPILLAPGR
jgi:hypothetical protein